MGKRTAQLPKINVGYARKPDFQVVCRSVRRVNEITGHDGVTPATTPTFVGRIYERSVEAHPDPGWHIQLCAGEEKLQWCIDTGAQVSITPKQVYQRPSVNC